MPQSLRTIGTLLLGVLVSSCAAGAAPEAGSSRAAPVAPVSGGVSGRAFATPVPMPPSFAEAMAQGTRTAAGVPGPGYWSQKVDYAIEAELDPETAVLRGRAVIQYQNNSPEVLDRLILHLYQNLFAPGAARTRSVPITGGITLESVAVGGEEFPDSGGRSARGSYLVDGTLMAVYLDDVVRSGETLELEVAWRFEVPPEGSPRTGHIDHALFNVAQWYPQVAVYDDLHGWDFWPYLGNGEFYLEYGDFDVAITVPEGWLVGASGALQNPEEVLPEMIRRRLNQAMTTDDVVRVVTEEDLGPGRATVSVDEGFLTWRFRAEGVRDFAFATSADYLWDASHAVTPDTDGDGQEEIVAVHALYRPVAETWTDAATYIRHAVTFHADRWHPYPWPQMTGAEGPVAGMEYPMLTFVAAFSEARQVYETLNHEIGHMWYPMMVGSNESSYPWMDEGLTTYIEGYATGDFFDEPQVWRNDQGAYLTVAGLERESPIMRHSDLHGPYGTYGQAAYWKPASLLRALESVIGQDRVWDALRAYSRAWYGRHPAPQDFFHLVEDISQRDLDWFWFPFWFGTEALDQVIRDVSVEDGVRGPVARISVANLGGAIMPMNLEISFSGGITITEEVPVEVWLEGAAEHAVSVDVPVGEALESVEIDPSAQLPDIDRENNVWGP